ncbi:MAG: nuclear transport factor 2 family protein [Caulobacteraceae bacterium]
MLKTAALAALLALAASPALAAPLPSDLEAASRAFDRAQAEGDRAALDRLLADGFVLVSGSGRAEGKAQFIRDLTDPQVREDPLTVLEPTQSLWDGGAVLGGLAVLNGTDHGARFTARIRFANVWAKKDGRWQVVYSHTIRAGD